MFYDTKFDAVLSVLIKPLEDLLNKKIKGIEDKVAEIKNASTKLTEYTEVDTDKEYYSAKATNEMFLALNQVFDIYDEAYNEKFATKTELEALKSELQGDIDTISELVGGGD